MRRYALALTLLTLAGCGTAPSHLNQLPVASEARQIEAIPQQIIVKLKSSYRTQSLESPLVAGTTKLESASFDTVDDTLLVKVPDTMTAAEAIAMYQANPAVEFAQQNYTIRSQDHPSSGIPVSADPLSGQQWHLSHLGLPEAWKTATGKGVVVAVIDSGIDMAHPDLRGQLIAGPDYIDGDGNPADENGHGTHVAGIVAARKDNTEGVCGVAPDAQVLAIRVLARNGGGSMFSIAKGIKFAADYGKKNKVPVVINLSLGGPAIPDPINWLAGKYANYKGALLVAAAGNSNSRVGTPARLSDYMAIGASTETNQKANFSNFGPEVSLAAPGVKIMSTMPTYDVEMTRRGVAKNYAAIQGTSMATPVVAGVAALVWSKNPEWTASQVRQKLESSGKDLGNPGRDPMFGAGLVDPVAALR